MRLSSLLAGAAAAVLTAITALGLAACGGIEVRSFRNEGVPSVLLGQWEGQWASSGSQGDGTVVVRVQEFDGDPVVSVEIDNPCIVPQVYQLSIGGSGIELRAGDEVVLSAALEGDRVLVGQYTCALDSGTWTADWSGTLPTILDLSGEWIGSALAQSCLGDDLLIQLIQFVDGGSIVLQGTVQFPTYMPSAVPVIGLARFREGDFDVVLHTTAGIFPALEMIGVGGASAQVIEAGVLVSAGGVALPFTSAVWTAVQTPR